MNARTKTRKGGSFSCRTTLSARWGVEKDCAKRDTRYLHLPRNIFIGHGIQISPRKKIRIFAECITHETRNLSGSEMTARHGPWVRNPPFTKLPNLPSRIQAPQRAEIMLQTKRRRQCGSDVCGLWQGLPRRN